MNSTMFKILITFILYCIYKVILNSFISYTILAYSALFVKGKTCDIIMSNYVNIPGD